MNIVLFNESDFISTHEVQLRAQRHIEHFKRVHNETADQIFDVGVINGGMGKGRLVSLTNDSVILSVEQLAPPPPPLPLQVIMALPRPKMLKRSLQHLAALGVKSIYLINTYRVEKSFWSTPWLEEATVKEQLLMGIEQARDTIMPEVHLRKRFKPFVEDELKAICEGTEALVAHPYTQDVCPNNVDHPITLIVGPEGGFIPYEIDLLQNQGVRPVSLGQRILRVETVIPYLVGRLFN